MCAHRWRRRPLGKDETTLKRVFFSYTKEDSATVTRVFDDLARAEGDLALWCYERSSEFGVDFLEEYRERLDSADVLLLFDSPHSRVSRYVHDEMQRWLRLENVRLLVCLIAPFGEWRSNEYFEGFNRITFIDFANYRGAIGTLAEELDASYRPMFVEPRDQDFEAELQAAGNAFDATHRQLVRDGYALFRDYADSNPHVAEGQLRVLIARFADPPPSRMPSPFLALGVLQYRLGRYAEAMSTFGQVAEYWPDDPRGWAGIAQCCFQLDRYREAVDALRNCRDAIGRPTGANHVGQPGDVIRNLAASLRAAGEAERALEELRNLPKAFREESASLRLAGLLLTDLGVNDQAMEMLEEVARRIIAGETASLNELIELIEGLRQLERYDLLDPLLMAGAEVFPTEPDMLRQRAVHFVAQGDPARGLPLYRLALERRPNDLRLLAETGLLLDNLGAASDSRAMSERAIDSVRRRGDDEYFLGLAHYLSGRHSLAEYHWSIASRDPVSMEWPYYSELVDK